jgi:hypothetical protein
MQQQPNSIKAIENQTKETIENEKDDSINDEEIEDISLNKEKLINLLDEYKQSRDDIKNRRKEIEIRKL